MDAIPNNSEISKLISRNSESNTVTTDDGGGTEDGQKYTDISWARHAIRSVGSFRGKIDTMNKVIIDNDK